MTLMGSSLRAMCLQGSPIGAANDEKASPRDVKMRATWGKDILYID
jgi:hypothetical protein